MIRKEQIEKCISIAKRYGARKIVLFGSAAEKPEAARDIDLLCDGVEGVDLIRMGAEMEEATVATIDVVPLTPLTRFARNALARGKVLYDRT